VSPVAASTSEASGSRAQEGEQQGEWLPVAELEDFPRGKRVKVSLGGRNAVLLWFRNVVYAIEERSPAEGAYSEGFASEEARLTPEGYILCPTTSSEFRLDDGALMVHCPGNAILRAVTPRPRDMEVFPTKVEGGMVYVNTAGTYGTESPGIDTKGGFGTSAEESNVFAIQPKVYVEGQGYEAEVDDTIAPNVQPATIVVGTLAAAIVAAAGTAVCLFYLESIPALIAFWASGFGLTALFIGPRVLGGSNGAGKNE
jgi:nitrite reductase/ring-hydroxylating ferredoxin subunit